MRLRSSDKEVKISGAHRRSWIITLVLTPGKIKQIALGSMLLVGRYVGHLDGPVSDETHLGGSIC